MAKIVTEGKDVPNTAVRVTDTLRYNPDKSGYEILSGNMWCGVPCMLRDSVQAMLDDMDDHIERRNPFDRED